MLFVDKGAINTFLHRFFTDLHHAILVVVSCLYVRNHVVVACATPFASSTTLANVVITFTAFGSKNDLSEAIFVGCTFAAHDRP